MWWHVFCCFTRHESEFGWGQYSHRARLKNLIKIFSFPLHVLIFVFVWTSSCWSLKRSRKTVHRSALVFTMSSLHFRTAHSHPSALSPLSVSLISSHYISFSLFCSPIIPPTHSHNCSATSKCRSQSHKPQTVDSWNIFVQRPDHYWPVTIHSIL